MECLWHAWVSLKWPRLVFTTSLHLCDIHALELLDEKSIHANNIYSKLNLDVTPTLFFEFHGTGVSNSHQAETTSKSFIYQSKAEIEDVGGLRSKHSVKKTHFLLFSLYSFPLLFRFGWMFSWNCNRFFKNYLFMVKIPNIEQLRNLK